jgi:hypothetical protein
MGFEDEAEQSVTRPYRQIDDRSKRTCELTSSIVPRGTLFHRSVELECSPVAVAIAIDPELLSCRCNLAGMAFPRFVSQVKRPPKPLTVSIRLISASGRSCVKTSPSQECAKSFSLLSSPDSGRQRSCFFKSKKLRRNFYTQIGHRILVCDAILPTITALPAP